ncbi:Bifunctional UDP-sugar hydrolase 5'-nucleotidase periplasmic [Seminavis robusta]|uniref:Bifunctional UDP-sugar hydrolase 5'-nucleotidase periplasmic n=1 Tax=Seminavis robusta TaxID=568900 RepID=A0A9N8DJ91_9STRA|nr:Bifunctional UDP-sugar hydrolase 5'-nucleotidase periplasmic [Seminavis robusta]|eukprot:Sro158_g071490.1 Bifunctional UDP-sugar hydrolase 5'-nucleotidase periplasmic (672) ;mRNA; r:22118-24133
MTSISTRCSADMSQEHQNLEEMEAGSQEISMRTRDDHGGTASALREEVMATTAFCSASRCDDDEDHHDQVEEEEQLRCQQQQAVSSAASSYCGSGFSSCDSSMVNSTATPPLPEIEFNEGGENADQNQDDVRPSLMRRSNHEDSDLMLKIVHERLSLQDMLQVEEQAVAAATLASVANLPLPPPLPPLPLPPSELTSYPAMARAAASASQCGAEDNYYVDCKPGQHRPPITAASASMVDSSDATIHSTTTTPAVAHSKTVGAFACAPSGNETASTSDPENSTDLTPDEEVAVRAAARRGFSSSVSSSVAALAIAAEVAPEMLDLERTITERVRREISEEVIRNSSADTTVIAEIVSLEDGDLLRHRRRKSRKERIAQQKRLRCRAAAAVLLLVTMVVAVVVMVACLSRNSNGPESDVDPSGSFPPDTTVLAHVPHTICYERIPLLGRSEMCPPQVNGSGVTNLIATSRLWNVREAQISILNAGEVHSDLPAGSFTMGQARKTLPYFDNELVLIHIKGAKLITAMERGIQKLFDDKAAAGTHLNSTTPSGAYPYGAGIRWKVNMTQPFPHRLYDVQINPRLSFDWEPINLHQIYLVVTNSYLQAGGDSYHEFSSAEDEHVIQTGKYSLESFVEYCEMRGVLLDPPHDYYSTQEFIHNPDLFEIGECSNTEDC